MEKRRNSYKTRGNSTEKRSGPVGVGAAVGGTAVRRVPSSAARCSPVSSQKCSLLSQMLCLGFLGLFSAFGSFPFSIPSLLSVTFPPFFPSPPHPPPPRNGQRADSCGCSSTFSLLPGRPRSSPPPHLRGVGKSCVRGRRCASAPSSALGLYDHYRYFFPPCPSSVLQPERRSPAAVLGTEGHGRDEAIAGAAGAVGSALSVTAVRRPRSAGRCLWRTAVRPGGADSIPAASPAARGHGTPRTGTSWLPMSAGRG